MHKYPLYTFRPFLDRSCPRILYMHGVIITEQVATTWKYASLHETYRARHPLLYPVARRGDSAYMGPMCTVCIVLAMNILQ